MFTELDVKQYGFSGFYFPAKNVIALSPSNCVHAGLGFNGKGGKIMLDVSSSSWRGK